jgi:hypothetical protein
MGIDQSLPQWTRKARRRWFEPLRALRVLRGDSTISSMFIWNVIPTPPPIPSLIPKSKFRRMTCYENPDIQISSDTENDRRIPWVITTDRNTASHHKKGYVTVSWHIRVLNRRPTGVCRGFSKMIMAAFGTKDFFEMACRLLDHK